MYSSTYSLSSELDGGEWSASRPGRFTPRDDTVDTADILEPICKLIVI